MNIAWLTPEVPYPPIGGRNGVYNRIVQLSKNNKIYLYSIAYNPEEKNNTIAMEKYCKQVRFYDRSENKLLVLLKSLFYPFSVASRYRKDIVASLEELIISRKIDFIIVDFPNMAKNISGLKKKYPFIKVTLNEHNVEYMRMRQMSQVKNISKIKRVAYYLESKRLEKYEKNIYKNHIFNGITFFSEDDYKFFKMNINTGSAVLKTIPLGANDYGKYPLKLNNKTLLFVGRLDHVAIPNVEAITWFYREVWPRIIQELPEAKLIIAGANPENEILKLEDSNITVISNFTSLEEVYGMADIVILPLLSGGGVKGKLLEAIAFRKLIVTTSHGIEGTCFKNKKHVSLCNTAIEFASVCIELLTHPDQYEIQEKQAYQLFIEKYNWNSIGKIYENFIKGLINGDYQ